VNELSDVSFLNTKKINEFQNSPCEGSSRLESYTDLIQLLNYCESIANEQTLFLFITDDELSMPNKK